MKLVAPFEDSHYQNVKKWHGDFEDIISLFNLSEFHKLILVKQCRIEKVKLLLQSESNLNNCIKFKSLLISEFGPVYKRRASWFVMKKKNER